MLSVLVDTEDLRAEGEAGFQKLDQLVEVHPWNRRNLANWQWKFKGNNPAGKPIMIYAENESGYKIILSGSGNTISIGEPDFGNTGRVRIFEYNIDSWNQLGSWK